MDAVEFDHDEFFAAIARSGARVLLIGRRALVALGIPVLTSDYDLWVHIDDVELLNRALTRLDFAPNRSPEECRRFGRYTLEDGVHVDVLVARAVPTVDGQRVTFDDLWERRQEIELPSSLKLGLPTIPDLILTKRFGARTKDLEDIRLLEALAGKAGS